MELFTIQCTTCRARLKVNDESVIGDILACPKCGSMVHVVPPDDSQTPTGEATAPTKRVAHEDRAAKKVAGIPPVLPQRPATKPLSAISSMTGLPPLPKAVAAAAIVGAPTTKIAPTNVAPPVAAPAPVANAAITAPVSAISSPTAPAAASRWPSDWKLLAGGLAGGIALGAIAWLSIVLLLRKPETTVANASAEPRTQSVEQEKSNTVQHSAAADAIEETVVAEPDAGREASAPLAANRDAAIDEPNTTSAESAAAKAAIDAPRPALSTTTKSPPAPAIKLDPAAREPVGPQVPAVPSANGDAETAPLGERANDHPADEPANVAEESSGALPARALTSDEIYERLSGPLPKVRFTKVPLAEFVDFINDFSGLTVVIDERALAKVSKSRQTPVTVKLSDTTARDALRSAVTSLGLTCVVRDGQLVITAVQK